MFTEFEAETKLRTKDQIADRALALCFIGLKSEGLSPERLAEIDKTYGITRKLTSIERTYVTAAHPTDQQQRDANWCYESLHVLLWAIGYVTALSYPDAMCASPMTRQSSTTYPRRNFGSRQNCEAKRKYLTKQTYFYALIGHATTPG
jgi:hypothetical protein